MPTTPDFYYGTEPDQLATTISEMWERWQSARKVARDRWKEVVQYVYATSTRETSNNKNGWNHSTHLPKLTQIFDNLGANYASALFGNPDFFIFRGADQSSVTKKKRTAIETYLKTKHLNNGFESEMLKILNDWVLYGNCFGMVEYVSEKHVDPETGEIVGGYEGPKVVRISPLDIVFNPMAESFQKSPKIVREILTRGDLIRAMEEKPELGYQEDAVRKLMYQRQQYGMTDTSDIDKQIQNKFDGFDTASEYFRSDYVELLHFHGDIFDELNKKFLKNVQITIADQQFIVRARETKTYSGYPNIFHVGWRLRTDNLWAMGPLDNLVGMQYRIDHLENAKADAFDQMLNPDEVYYGNVQITQEGPVRRFYVDDASTGKVEMLRPDTTVLQADFEIQRIEAAMEAYAGAPREAMGIRSPGEKTAFEVQQLLNAAGKLFQHKIEFFERNFLEPILNGELECARRNLNTLDVAEVLDDDLGVIEFLNITKEDLTAAGKLVPMGARHFTRTALLAQQLRDFHAILGGDLELKQHFPARKRAEIWNELLGFDKFGLLEPFGQIAENMEAQQLAMTAQEMTATMPDGLDVEQAMTNG